MRMAVFVTVATLTHQPGFPGIHWRRLGMYLAMYLKRSKYMQVRSLTFRFKCMCVQNRYM